MVVLIFVSKKRKKTQRAYATNNLNVKNWECSGYASCDFYGNLKEVFVSLELISLYHICITNESLLVQNMHAKHLFRTKIQQMYLYFPNNPLIKHLKDSCLN